MADDSADFPGWWAPYEIAAAVDRINDLETLFGADANPVYAMQALDIARLCSIPLPEWVLDWLGAGVDGVARPGLRWKVDHERS